MCRNKLVTTVIFAAVIAVSSMWTGNVFAYDAFYGPGLELGAGLTGLQMNNNPGWIGDYYGSGFGSGALRIYKGLSIQGGFGFGKGQDPKSDWVGMTGKKRLWSQEGSSIGNVFYGLRYEIPMYRFNFGKLGPEFIYVGVGIDKKKFKIESSVVDNDGVPELNGTELYELASVTGYYYTLAGRWKIKTDETIEGDSWFGSYGLDVGVRYFKHSDSELKYAGSQPFKSSFNSMEIFVLAFMKVKLLY